MLPFENLSDDKEHAFFADGVQDELLSNLSKIKGLKVISRTSVMQYKAGIMRNLKDIAQQLGVSNVVEGNVRRSGNHVRVSVQLIDAQTERHIWVQNYDRTLADSLALQGDLATEIAAGVGAKFESRKKRRAWRRSPRTILPPTMPICVVAHLQLAHTYESNLEVRSSHYQEAVKLDPSFALAWACLSCKNSELLEGIRFKPGAAGGSQGCRSIMLSRLTQSAGNSSCSWLLPLLRAARFHLGAGGIPAG